MAMRSVVSRTGLCHRLMEGNWRSSSASNLRYLSDGRVLNEEERAQETVYIKKMERERLEKMKKKAEQEQADKVDKSDKAGSDANKS